MKKCPKCNNDYFDNMLDYCLEDGAKLVSVSENTRTKTVEQNENSTLADTVFIQTDDKTRFPADAPEIETVVRNDLREQIQTKSEKLKTSLTDKWFQVLELAPIILALAHNYWQWLYLSKRTGSQISEFLFSYQFLIWLLLLIAAVGFSIVSLKYGRTKSFAITSLVILAINILLSIVPK